MSSATGSRVPARFAGRAVVLTTVLVGALATACLSTNSRDEALSAHSFMDPRIEKACSTTARTCSRCHDLGKVLITHFDASLPWRQLVRRMRRMPSSGIDDAEVRAAETCLVYHDLGHRGLDELASLSEKP